MTCIFGRKQSNLIKKEFLDYAKISGKNQNDKPDTSEKNCCNRKDQYLFKTDDGLEFFINPVNKKTDTKN